MWELERLVTSQHNTVWDLALQTICIIFFVQTNTFQGIVITNGYQSFTVFTYRCGSMQWSGNAVIGFKANSELSSIHEFSGRNAKSVACRNLPMSVWSNVVYQLRKYNHSTHINTSQKDQTGGGGRHFTFYYLYNYYRFEWIAFSWSWS